MKNQKRTKKRNPRSEAAMREAIKCWTTGECRREFSLTDDNYPTVNFYKGFHQDDAKLIAIFDLRDCYRKRKPLTGITKKLRKAIQPKRSRK